MDQTEGVTGVRRVDLDGLGQLGKGVVVVLHLLQHTGALPPVLCFGERPDSCQVLCGRYPGFNSVSKFLSVHPENSTVVLWHIIYVQVNIAVVAVVIVYPGAEQHQAPGAVPAGQWG